MRVIESYNTRTKNDVYPCVMEDDQGIRLLVTPPVYMPATWNSAVAHGIRGVIVVGTPNVFYTLDAFTSKGQGYPCQGYPSYLEGIGLAPPPPAKSQFVHLHTHSEFSSLDGLSTVDEIVKAAAADNQGAVAVTDHGVCASHPHLQDAATKAGVKPIFGIEAYFVDDMYRRPKGLPDGRKKADLDPDEVAAYEADNAFVKDYWHLILWAMNDDGLRNLWAMSSEAHQEGVYWGKARMDWRLIEKYGAGIMCSTACLRGPVASAIKVDDEEQAVARMARLQAIFPDRLYAEIHTNSLPEQVKVNNGLVDLAQRFSLPLIAVCDSHYSCGEHADAHKVWLAAQIGKTINEETGMFGGEDHYYMMTEEQARNALSYLPSSVVDEAITNTGLVADQCTAAVKGSPEPPIYSVRGGHDRDVERLLRICVDNWGRTQGKKHSAEEYVARLEKEMVLLKEKGFCGYFLMVQDYVQWAKDHGIFVGPGRGSGGGSLVAYLCKITEIDPVDADLLFERFMTEGRKELPDFDVDFPSKRMDEVFAYVRDRWGEDAIVRVGTHLRLKNKGVLSKLFTTLQGTVDVDWNDRKKISEIITEAESGTAGMGLTWEELWDQEGDLLEEYRRKYPEVFRYADILVGRLHSYGKHAAGVIISTDGTLKSRVPMRRADNGEMVTEFDMNAAALLGMVKFDFLGLRTLDTLQMCIDLVAEHRGIALSPYEWRDEYEDEDVWKFISDGNTLGCFQIETSAGTRITKQVRPSNLHELADVVTLDRPGPQRSGLDRAYLDRKHGRAKVTYPDPRLETVLDRSFGVLLYQEDIMATCMVLAGYSSEEADGVRKILGKKQVDKVKLEGTKFRAAAIERGMDPQACEQLWDQMEAFAKYAFNRSHAYAYGLLAYWTAYLKYHYPQEFYVAAMSTVDQNRVGEFVNEARRRGYKVLPPDVNRSGKDFTVDGEAIRYGLGVIKGVGEKAVESIIGGQPYASVADFRERKVANMGIVKLLVRVGAFDSVDDNRARIEAELAREESGDLIRCSHYNAERIGAPNGLPCDFDWSSEPVRLGVRGKPLKAKEPPKACTVRCRNYDPVEAPPLEVEPYTPKKVRQIELEYLGAYLSSTPFDILYQKKLTETTPLYRASQVDDFDSFESAVVPCIVHTVREKTDRRGKRYAILTVYAQDGLIDAICFASNWKAVKPRFQVGEISLFVLSKNDRGYQVKQAVNLSEVEP
jgi:DNA polymerase III subunit alpha